MFCSWDLRVADRGSCTKRKRAVVLYGYSMLLLNNEYRYNTFDFLTFANLGTGDMVVEHIALKDMTGFWRYAWIWLCI